MEISWIRNSFQWFNNYYIHWNWDHFKWIVFSISLLGILYELFWDRSIDNAEKLTKKVSFIFQVTELRDIDVQVQDMILLDQVINYYKSFLRNENPKSLKYHWNTNGLLCEDLRYYHYLYFREYRARNDDILRLKDFLKGKQDPLFNLNTASDQLPYYELEYIGDYNESNLRLAKNQLLWITGTYKIWTKDKKRDRTSIDEIISNLKDLQFHLNDISYFKNKSILYLDEFREKSDRKRDEDYTSKPHVELEYQYIYVMQSLVRFMDQYIKNKDSDNITWDWFYWHKGLFCKAKNSPSNDRDEICLDTTLDKAKDKLFDHREVLIYLPNEIGDDSYGLKYKGSEMYDDDCDSSVRFRQQIEYLMEMLSIYRGGGDVSSEDHYIKDLTSLFSKMVVKSMMGVLEFRCSQNLSEIWKNIPVNYRIMDGLVRVVNNNLPYVLHGNELRNLILPRDIDESKRMRYELRIKRFNEGLIDFGYQYKLFTINAPDEQHPYYWLSTRNWDNEFQESQYSKTQSAVSQIQWIINTYELFTDKYDGPDKVLRDTILMNLKEVSKFMSLKGRKVLLDPVELRFEVPGKYSNKKNNSPPIELEYQYVHLMMKLLDWCCECQYKLDKSLSASRDSLNPEFYWYNGLLRQGKTKEFSIPWEVLKFTRDRLMGHDKFLILLDDDTGFGIRKNNLDTFTLRKYNRSSVILIRDIELFLNQIDLLHGLMYEYCKVMSGNSNWIKIDKLLGIDVPIMTDNYLKSLNAMNGDSIRNMKRITDAGRDTSKDTDDDLMSKHYLHFADINDHKLVGCKDRNVELRYQYVRILKELIDWSRGEIKADRISNDFSGIHSTLPLFHWKKGILRGGYDSDDIMNKHLIDKTFRDTSYSLSRYDRFLIQYNVLRSNESIFTKLSYIGKKGNHDSVREDIEIFEDQVSILSNLITVSCNKVRNNNQDLVRLLDLLGNFTDRIRSKYLNGIENDYEKVMDLRINTWIDDNLKVIDKTGDSTDQIQAIAEDKYSNVSTMNTKDEVVVKTTSDSLLGNLIESFEVND